MGSSKSFQRLIDPLDMTGARAKGKQLQALQSQYDTQTNTLNNLRTGANLPAWLQGRGAPGQGQPLSQQTTAPMSAQNFLQQSPNFMGATPYGQLNAQMARMQSMRMMPPQMQRFLPPQMMQAMQPQQAMASQNVPAPQQPVGFDPRQLPPVPNVGLPNGGFPMLPNGIRVPGKIPFDMNGNAIDAGQTPPYNPFPFGRGETM